MNMKGIIFCVSILCVTVSCNNAGNNEVTKTGTVKEDTTTSNAITIPGKMCFQNILQRDTVQMELFIKDSIVYGNLIYNRYEKDDNKGTFKGTIHGNIIKADYTYTSEGTMSVREIMFKLKNNTITEGFGEMEEKSGRFNFKKDDKVQFTQVYQAVDCK